MPSAPVLQRIAAMPPLLLALGCLSADQSTGPEAVPAPGIPTATATTAGFTRGSATPESQGMCGTTLQLGCARLLSTGPGAPDDLTGQGFREGSREPEIEASHD